MFVLPTLTIASINPLRTRILIRSAFYTANRKGVAAEFGDRAIQEDRNPDWVKLPSVLL